MVFYLEHAIQDAGLTRAGERRIVSKRMLYVEQDADGATRYVHYAPYLDYRPLAPDEPGIDAILDRTECRWIDRELERKAQLSPLPPVVLGGLLVVPIGLIRAMTGQTSNEPTHPVDTQASAARARAIVMAVERGLGFEPTDREFEKLGYDIESRVPGTGKLRSRRSQNDCSLLLRGGSATC
ncbi:hypothetical protein [Thiocapsa imhoffii]|uniref:hypothetical protein n=1 Tax=Thiocapsa imhoffii TaxID=382777 RepID=UPI0019058DF4|nr:hypothetical protein [Thiocapsa imhoffii]